MLCSHFIVFPIMIPKFDNEAIISSLRLRRHYRYCGNRHHNHHRYHRHCYYCFCVIVKATSGEEGLKSIMKEIGLGKELGDSPLENVVQFIGCVTSQSKKAILCILQCLLFEMYTSFFLVCLFFGLGNDRYLRRLRNIFNKQNDRKLLWKLSILWIL